MASTGQYAALAEYRKYVVWDWLWGCVNRLVRWFVKTHRWWWGNMTLGPECTYYARSCPVGWQGPAVVYLSKLRCAIPRTVRHEGTTGLSVCCTFLAPSTTAIPLYELPFQFPLVPLYCHFVFFIVYTVVLFFILVRPFLCPFLFVQSFIISACVHAFAQHLP